MTCIVGVEKFGKVWLGGDSAGTKGSGEQISIGDSKVFRVGKFGFGICGIVKTMDALKYAEFEQPKGRVDPRKFVSTVFVPQFISSMKKIGAGTDEGFDGEILVALSGKLFKVDSGYQVIVSSTKFDAVGSGSRVAIGSLHSTKSKLNPKTRVLTALEAAAAGDAMVRPPFNIIVV